jgi:class 3 adenylate cyclase/tetratricopeptide (TPR) repeat protein
VTSTRIFISYARATADRARLVARGFAGDDFDVWIDDRLLAHRSFTDAIEEALGAADAVVVVWSAEAVKSDWVRAEATRGREMGKLVQVRIDHCALPLPFDQIHCIDLSSWAGEGEAAEWRTVMDSVAAVTGAATPHPGRRPEAPEAQTVSERRQITALFCKTVDSASLPSRLDPEDLMLVVEAYRELCDYVIPQYGGIIAKHLDHGTLAYFGYPRAHEEEGVNALRAGLALCAAAARLDLPADLRVGVQVGVATGLVVIGEASRTAREPNIVGETPHLATQLASLAPANGVVASATTRRITDGMFEFRGLEGATAPDGASPLAAFEVLAAANIASRSQARALDEPASLFGRDRELELLGDGWASAEAGNGQVVLVEGEAGIGKSELVAAFRQTPPRNDAVAMTWHCGSAYSARALHPVAEALERDAGFEARDAPEVRRGKLAGWLARWGMDGPQPAAILEEFLGVADAAAEADARPDADRRRAMTIDLLLELMARRAADGPALFIVEDLHWADPTTLDLLDRMVRRAADERWMIVATARPEFQCGWFEHSDVTRIRLGQLDRADAQRICAAIDKDGRLPAEVRRQILARGDGVPLFIEEITKAVLEALADAPEAQAADQLPVPSTLQDSLIARLDRLGPAKQVARVGAAIGRAFSFPLIAAVAGQPPAELRQALRDLAKSGLVDATGAPPHSHYVFRQALICDAAYDSLPKRQREALHARIAEALRNDFPDAVAADPGRLAHHLARGGAVAEAIPLWAQAGGQAAAKAAHFEAIDYLERALTHLRAGERQPADVAVELQLLIGLAVSLAAARGYAAPEVGKALSEARAICDALGNVADLFAVLRGICAFSIVAGDLETAEQLARRCQEIGLETLRPEHRIEGECALGYVLWVKGELAPARRHLEACVQLYLDHDGSKLPPVTPQDPLIQSLGPLQALCCALGDDAAAERASRRLLAHAKALDGTFSHAFGLFWYAFHALSIGDFATARTYGEEAVALCDRQGYTAVAPHASMVLAFAAGHLGDAPEALKRAQRDLAEIDRQGQVHTRGWKLGEIGALHAAMGDLPAALAAVDEAIETAERADEGFWLSPLHRQRAEVLALLPDSDPGAVDAALETAVAIAKAQGAVLFADQAARTKAKAALAPTGG